MSYGSYTLLRKTCDFLKTPFIYFTIKAIDKESGFETPETQCYHKSCIQ